MVDRAWRAGGEPRRGGGLFLGGAAVFAAEHGRAEMPLAGGTEQRALVSRVQYGVVDLLTKEARLREV